MTEVVIDMDEHEHVSIAPAWNRQGEIFYQGFSMTPGFQPGEDRLVVHRVVSIGSDGIRTKADRGDHVDPWILNPELIRGCVVSFERGKKRYAVLRGFAGRFHAGMNHPMAKLDFLLSHILHPIYRWLSEKGTFRRLLPASLKPRVLYFDRPGASVGQILLGNRVIGRYVAGEG